jgi:hypothetical protein
MLANVGSRHQAELYLVVNPIGNNLAAYTAVQNQLAEQRLLAKSRSYDNQREIRKADGTVRHKCFLSYHHDDAAEVEEFVNKFEDVFIPKVIGTSDQFGDLIDSYDDDYVMDRIREKYLTDSTVTIVFNGKCTSTRKFIDWEIYSSLRNDSKNKRNGLVAIQLKSNTSPGAPLPSRFALNRGAEGTETYARYWVYPASASTLKAWIEDAFQARETRAKWVKLGGTRVKFNSACSS